MHETRYLLVGATKWLVHRALPVILDLFSASLVFSKLEYRILNNVPELNLYMEYTDKNIDSLLMSRCIAKKVRNAGGRLKGPSKRTKEETEAFVRKLREILEESE